MMIQQILLAYGGEVLLGVDSAQFDGANDFMTRGAGLTGAVDSKTGIFSCWIRLDGGNGASNFILSAATTIGGANVRFEIERGGTNVFFVRAFNAATTEILRMATVSTYLAGATWRHLLMSWDQAAGATHLYVNDVSDKTVAINVNDTIDYTYADWAIGAIANGSLKLNGCPAELYFAPGQFLDFSIVSNRRKFISAGGKPVFLGTTGSLPTGTAPLVYQHLNIGEAVADFATNRATGGNFTITGTLTTGSTRPSD